MEKRLSLKGTVSSGLGEAKYFTQLGWVVEQFRTKLGFVPYPGTLNLDLTKYELESLVKWFGQTGGVVIAPESEAYCSAICFPAQISDCIQGAVVIPEVTKHPMGRLEVIAPVNIREALKISDGDVVNITLEK